MRIEDTGLYCIPHHARPPSQSRCRPWPSAPTRWRSVGAGRRPAAGPEAVNGWREYPLRDGVISIQPAKWRTDKVRVPVPAGKGLEYKLTMKKGEGLVYNIGYGALNDPG